MAIGKNKKLGKKKKATGRKQTDLFAKKEWYQVKAPTLFPKRDLGYTVVTKTTGQRVARDGLLGRVFEQSFGDLKDASEDDAFRKFRFKVEEVAGTQCLTSFYGLTLSSDKLKSLVRKWHTLIEAHADVKTTDGHVLRLFVIGFTKRRPGQAKKTQYAQTSQVKAIRKRMVEVMHKEAGCELSAFVNKLTTETIGREIERVTQGIYPLQNVHVRKVKLMRSPKLDLGKLLENHGGAEAIAAADQGSKVERPEDAKKESKKSVKAKKKKMTDEDDDAE